MKIEEFWRRLRKWCLQAKKGNRNRFVGELWTTQCEDWVFLCSKWSDSFWIFSEISWPDHLWFHKHNMLLWRRRTVCMYIEVTYSVREEYSTWVQTCCTLIYEGGTLFQRRPCLSQTFVINRCSTLWGLQLNWLRFIHERRGNNEYVTLMRNYWKFIQLVYCFYKLTNHLEIISSPQNPSSSLPA